MQVLKVSGSEDSVVAISGYGDSNIGALIIRIGFTGT